VKQMTSLRLGPDAMPPAPGDIESVAGRFPAVGRGTLGATEDMLQLTCWK
jgi:hypothetical protein